MRENDIDEAQKADVSQNEEESPASEGMEIMEGPINEELREQARPDESEGEEVETESTEEVEAEGTPEEEPETKEGRKTAESRIKQLVEEKKTAEKRADSLADQMKKLTSQRPEPTYIPPATQPEDTELTYEELMRRQDALIQIRLAQQENIHRVQQESTEAINAYPELNPDSDKFNPTLSERVSNAVLKVVKADPTTSVKEFVADMMTPFREAVEKQASDQRETITKQVSQRAMRPTQVQEQEKPFSELSIEEMEKKLGIVYR